MCAHMRACARTCAHVHIFEAIFTLGSDWEEFFKIIKIMKIMKIIKVIEKLACACAHVRAYARMCTYLKQFSPWEVIGKNFFKLLK